MKYLYDIKKIKQLLSMYTYEMYNKENNYKGEITVLSGKDIDDIVYDMVNNIFDKPKMYIDKDGVVVVEYPYDICKLESREKLK